MNGVRRKKKKKQREPDVEREKRQRTYCPVFPSTLAESNGNRSGTFRRVIAQKNISYAKTAVRCKFRELSFRILEANAGSTHFEAVKAKFFIFEEKVNELPNK